MINYLILFWTWRLSRDAGIKRKIPSVPGMLKVPMIKSISGAFFEEVEIIKSLGEGTYGKVDLIKHRDKFYAIKYLRPDGDHILPRHGVVEMAMLCRLQSYPEIIRVYGVCLDAPLLEAIDDRDERFDPENVVSVMIMKIMETDLTKFSWDTDTSTRLGLVRQLYVSLLRMGSECEAHGILHLDIKPANILVSYSSGLEFRLTDFGMAHQYFGEYTMLYEEPCSLRYRPPEYLSYYPNDARAQKIDVWAYGLTLLEFITGKPVLGGLNNKGVLLSIAQETGELEKYESYEDFVTAVKAGTADGHIEVEKLLEKENIPLTAIDADILAALTAMLSLKAEERPLMSELAAQAGLAPYLKPQSIICQRVSTELGIHVIVESGYFFDEGISNTLIALELYTRWSGFFPLRATVEVKLDALACAYLASLFSRAAATVPTQYAEIVDDPAITSIMIEEQAKEILTRLRFRVYNDDLTPIIMKAFSKKINLRNINYEVFGLPLEKWLD